MSGNEIRKIINLIESSRLYEDLNSGDDDPHKAIIDQAREDLIRQQDTDAGAANKSDLKAAGRKADAIRRFESFGFKKAMGILAAPEHGFTVEKKKSNPPRDLPTNPNIFMVSKIDHSTRKTIFREDFMFIGCTPNGYIFAFQLAAGPHGAQKPVDLNELDWDNVEDIEGTWVHLDPNATVPNLVAIPFPNGHLPQVFGKYYEILYAAADYVSLMAYGRELSHGGE
jgi:hypothetical protein